ncbi:MarR family winged helix-turn-helix transcriptional regulator [Agrilactobacillus yilanensis]|uniref:MarR family winged helix-turn-helix transcriptional regulator n=1 Tax=Agrilactobacillus yilanensis TaxID=2485997 RepID=A0ABW4J565_9LACO|nr:MarR family transcriptional regulator [Agrilactobacillus yilanensis]
MTETSRDLLNSFGKLFQNRGFFLAVSQHGNFMGKRSPNGGRGPMRLIQLFKQSPDGLTNAEISQLLDIRPSSVSAMITRLEDKGIVERVPSDVDKRAMIIRLTDEGKNRLNHQSEKVDDLADQLFSGLTDEEQVELEKLIKKLDQSAADLDWQAFMGHHGHHGMGMGYGYGHGHGQRHEGSGCGERPDWPKDFGGWDRF